MTHYVGVDPGLAHTGIACLLSEHGKPRFHSCKLITTAPKQGDVAVPDERRVAAVSFAIHQYMRTLHARPVQRVAIERVYHNNNRNSSMTTAMIIGAAISTFSYTDLLLVNPRTLKHDIAGTGDADKRAMHTILSAMITGYPRDLSDHETDAIGLALYAMISNSSISAIPNNST